MSKLLPTVLLTLSLLAATPALADEATDGPAAATEELGEGISARDPETPEDGETEGTDEPAVTPDETSEVGFLGDFGWAMSLAWLALLGLPLVLTVGLFALAGDKRDEAGAY